MKKLNRRNFIKVTGSTSIGLTVLTNPLTVLSAGTPASKVVVAIMGVRGRGNQLAINFAHQENSEVAYICDVDEEYRNKCIDNVSKIQQRRPVGENDFRRILDDKSIDAIVIAAPDHWHAPATITGLAGRKACVC